MAERLNDYLGGLTTIEEKEAGKATLMELIADGESTELEFKSSLRWDYRQGCTNKDLEAVVVKTAAAFANSEGGRLLIGVDDAGLPAGLENDYASLQGDRDRFEQHLINLLNEQLRKSFVAQSIKITFPVVDNIEICQVDVSRSSSPRMISGKDKQGVNTEKFYVRSGNTSQELSMSEFDSYQKDRF